MSTLRLYPVSLTEAIEANAGVRRLPWRRESKPAMEIGTLLQVMSADSS